MKIPASHVKMGAQLAEQFPAFQAEFSIYGSFEKTYNKTLCLWDFIQLIAISFGVPILAAKQTAEAVFDSRIHETITPNVPIILSAPFTYCIKCQSHLKIGRWQEVTILDADSAKSGLLYKSSCVNLSCSIQLYDVDSVSEITNGNSTIEHYPMNTIRKQKVIGINSKYSMTVAFANSWLKNVPSVMNNTYIGRSSFRRQYVVLYAMACDYLAVPPASVASERANSLAERMFEGRETLNSDLFTAEISCSSWMKVIAKYNLSCDPKDVVSLPTDYHNAVITMTSACFVKRPGDLSVIPSGYLHAVITVSTTKDATSIMGGAHVIFPKDYLYVYKYNCASKHTFLWGNTNVKYYYIVWFYYQSTIFKGNNGGCPELQGDLLTVDTYYSERHARFGPRYGLQFGKQFGVRLGSHLGPIRSNPESGSSQNGQ
ncbi:hypothetical protein BDR26DRAFT_968780 [Obelidium mucronatum]|nr:hypothetical protein BDR26DRAFT_968780 [Obelidium mucronatum]